MLNCHSYFSFKYGLIALDEWMQLAAAYGYKTLALTDINTTAGTLEFIRLCKKKGIRPIVGIDFRNGAEQRFVGLARNNKGFERLNRFLSFHLHHEEPFDEASLMADTFIIYPLDNVPGRALQSHEFIGIRPDQVNRVRFTRKELDRAKLVALPSYTLRSGDQFELHSVLRAIDLNTIVSKLAPADTARETDVVLKKQALIEAYQDLPVAINNLKAIVEDCAIDFQYNQEAQPQNLRHWTGTEIGDYQQVRTLCLEGLPYRYGKQPPYKVLRRVVTELLTIRQQGFLSYFLISWDLVQYARNKGYFHVGRGSGANSVVAYLLRITDVDPIELDLYFERFINLFRENPPDFDIDFSWSDREDVTRYLFERYENVALIATYSTFQFRSVIREVGKAFGIPPHEIDKIQSQPSQNLDGHHQLILQYGQQIHDFPSHLSVHAGGVLISEKPIHHFTATSLPPKGFPITHFDMVIAEDVGLYKFDILAQRGLGKIKDALPIIQENQPGAPEFDIHDIKRFKEDPVVRENLRTANAIGCFYIESPAMRMLLTKLRVEDYLGLVAASSIIRPGVSKSGMMREYILRYRYPEKRKEAHPILHQIMPDTYGVMVYQEDVIKVAHYFAGLDLGEADVLRRGMSGKYRSRAEFQKVKEKFFTNCQKKGIDSEVAADVWRQIESFAGYAFAKGHSASYAVESYQSLFLKSYFPLEFMVAVLNNGGGFYSPEFYVHEARMKGADIQPPHVNKSDFLNRIEGQTIYLGFGMVKELEKQVVAQLLEERDKNGGYVSVEDYVRRVSVSLEQLCLLIRVGAFEFTGLGKKEMLWKAHFLLGNTKKSQVENTLFDPPVKDYTLPDMIDNPLEDIYDQMELLGFPLSSPFSLLESIPTGVVPAREMKQNLHRTIDMLGYLVTTKNTGTSKGDRMYFGTFIDQEGVFIDSLHFPPVAKAYPFTGRGIYQLTGKVVEDFDALTLEVSRMHRLNYRSLDV